MIKPTIGRVVWFKPSSDESDANFVCSSCCAAIIAHVWSDTCVNLAVFDANGNSHSKTSVLLIQEGNPVPGGGYYCEWMPYQKGQAAKTEKVESDLEAIKRMASAGEPLT
jgi:hypothetical protein